MMKIYKFNDVIDMVDLAKQIQTNVYWSASFYLNKDYDNRISYRDFWDICETAIASGSTAVSILEEDVQFIY